MSEVQICKTCIYDEHVPAIKFDAEGVCNYCRQVEQLKVDFSTGQPEGEQVLMSIIEQIKKDGKGKKYDCVIGVSGGTDSSYLLIKALEWGLRPLAVHYDNTWNSAIATENIRKVTSALKIDLYTHVLDNRESEDLFRSFLFAGVPEFDASTDIGFVQVIRSTAAKFGVKYILEGHSFVAEGVSPMGKNYFDGKYIKDIHKKYGRLKKLRTYPNMTFFQFMKWALVYRQKFIRPLWYLDYSKEQARELLIERTGWQYYGGHHLENRSAAFLHTYYNPVKFNIDNRNWTLSADVRAGKMSQEDALEIYRQPVIADPELINYVRKRLNLTEQDLTDIVQGEKRTFRDFKTYKKRFERLRPLFKILVKAKLVPTSFYLKYCFPLDDAK
ncbi:LPS biosynthesis protein [Pseudidiomarina tainanensis]|uniref:LPS biosynthesis protein n=1 Tax=Pseudidiomarina tainanensis TaxID=502365 RepID=A0ACD2HIT5_9GAMM|nr:N-acetyl sugar amidotransferase [Pseudidiomarina tainanensis]RZQ56289.1 LPS biosynthesis protein [Pseudidiomarina tainanensis]